MKNEASLFLILFIIIAFVLTVAIARDPSVREPRRIISFKKHVESLEEERYQYCQVANITSACLEKTACSMENGIFMGYCGHDGTECCSVVKTCNMESASHVVRFMSPKFPENETESRACPLALHIGKGICAVRLTIDVLELSKYQSDHCTVDSFTVLGTDEIMSPVCGNMSNWETTFEVKENSEITLALNLQGNPHYRFSMLVTQLACKDIHPIKSAVNAGLKNLDADKYIPTSTTTTTTTTERTNVSAETTTNSSEDITTIIPEEDIATTYPAPPRSADITTPESTVSKHTPIPTGTFVPATTARTWVEVKSADDGIRDYYDPTSRSSIFRKIFESKIKDKCLTYEEPFFKGSDPLSPSESFSVDHPECWLYDKVSGQYRVSEHCAFQDNIEEEEQSFRIIGGQFANINEYPWQVAILYKNKFFCGGALISDRHIATAAHCIFGSFYSGIHNLRISLGDHDLRTKNETNNHSYGVKKAIWNMHFNVATTKNDIAILELDTSVTPVDFNYGITPVLLPTDETNTYAGQNATVTGWGRHDSTKKKTSSILKEYTAAIDDIDNCVKLWKRYPKISAIKDKHICLNVTFGTPCHGDSGGPLVSCNNGSRCTLIGVVSFGFPLCTNVGLPAVFTRITSYKRWIDINTTPVTFINAK